MLPLDELRDLLVAGVPVATRDAVRRQLATAARTWGPAWVVGAVGVAAPGLTRMAARLCHAASGLAEGIDSEILWPSAIGCLRSNLRRMYQHQLYLNLGHVGLPFSIVASAGDAATDVRQPFGRPPGHTLDLQPVERQPGRD
jgi:hypothetical protein